MLQLLVVFNRLIHYFLTRNTNFLSHSLCRFYFGGLPNLLNGFISRKYKELAKDINKFNINTLISESILEKSKRLALLLKSF